MSVHKKSVYEKLKAKWIAREKKLSENLFLKHAGSIHSVRERFKHVTATTAAGLMLLTNPGTLNFSLPHFAQGAQQAGAPINKASELVLKLSEKIPQEVRPLTLSEEKDITGILTDEFGFTVTASLDGKRLNRNFGIIGQEQHLSRFPEDTIDSHFESQKEALDFSSSGMAPGLGAWGYFASSSTQVTQKDILREKYYIAVQTFLSDHFNERFSEYRDFFKYRKMLVVNPYNGEAVVADIADAGPSEWTGKHLGGSPEVMQTLERLDGSQRGSVLYFFIDDPKDQIPLGPISYNSR